MQIITNNISKNKKLNHVILDMPLTARTYSASLLLRDYYRDLDIDYNRENDWRYYYIVRRHFLRKVKRNGHWVCHYCQKPVHNMLIRNKNRQSIKNRITVDHKIPASECTDILDTSNFLECCYECNRDKGNIPYHEFKARLRKAKLKKEKLELSLV